MKRGEVGGIPFFFLDGALQDYVKIPNYEM